MPGGQQLQVRPGRHQSLAVLQDLARMRGVGRDDRHPDQRTPMQIQVPRLGHGHLEPPSDLGQQWPHRRPLLLQRPDVTEEQIEFESTDVQGTSP